MNFYELLENRGILKIFFVIFSMLLWIFFLVSSNATLTSLININLNVLANTFFTTNFLLFLLFFPITTYIVVSYSVNQYKKISLLQTIFSFTISIIISFILFNLSLFFILFLVGYLVAHLILILFIRSRFELDKEVKLFTLHTYASSKLNIILIILIFLCFFMFALPNQKEKAITVEASFVNFFIGGDISKLVGMSNSINYACTEQTLRQVIYSKEFINLESSNDLSAKTFVNFLTDRYNNLEEYKDNLPVLDTTELKNKTLLAIKDMPLVSFLENFFALFFAIFLISFVYIYFNIVFGLLGIIYLYLFYKIFI